MFIVTRRYHTAHWPLLCAFEVFDKGSELIGRRSRLKGFGRPPKGRPISGNVSRLPCIYASCGAAH